MQFKRLRLSGFKSFVEPTEFIIEPGLTGIVGPNGCGKSNLTEALRWVMGENSPKRMRGEMMDDVIFGGTEKRPSRNLAEVTLLIDNDDHKAPAPFTNESQLEVSRRIEREAGSSYRINGKEVRAKDVQLLFADSATGPTSPAIVSQGKVNAFINAKPEERRVLLEEAAGITGLHVRRKEAELRLKAAGGNLQRLDDIMEQMKTQADNLRKQARQASRYKNLAGHILKTQSALYFMKWRGFEDSIAVARRELNEAERLVAADTGTVAKVTADNEELQQSLPAFRQKAVEKAAAHTRLKIAFEALDAEERSLKTRLNELTAHMKQLEQDLAREAANAKEAGAFVSLQDAEAQSLRNALAAEEANAGDVEQRYQAALTETKEAESKFNKLNDAATEKKIRTAHIREEFLFLASRKKRLLEETQSTKINLGAAQQEAPAANATVISKLADLNEILTHAEKNLKTAEDQKEHASLAVNEMREKASELRTEVAALSGEITALTKLLNSRAQGDKPAISSNLLVEEGYEAALGAALGDDLEAPESDQNNTGWWTLPPLSSAPALPKTAVPLSNFIRAPQALARRLSQIGVVEHAEGATLMRELRVGQRLVSREGSLWRWDGLVRAGNAPTSAALHILYKNRCEKLENEKRAREKTLENHALHLKEAETVLAAKRAQENAARQAYHAADESYRTAREESALLEEGAVKAVERVATLTEALSRLEKDLNEIKEKETALTKEAEKLSSEKGEDGTLEQARIQLDEARGRLSSVRGKFDIWHEIKSEKVSRLASLENEKDAWQRRGEEASVHITELKKRQEETEAALKTIETNPMQFATRRNALLEQMVGTESAVSAAQEELSKTEILVQDKTRELKELEKKLAALREDMVRRQTTLQSLRDRQAELEQFVQEEFGCPPAALLDRAGMDEKEKNNLPALSESEEKLERLKAERERLGAVNLRADVELQELDTEIQRLVNERGELEEAIRKLRSSITSLNREGREKLLSAFETVNKNFNELFIRIFNGGKAQLILTEGEDPLEAGLDIMASPPGKKLLHRSLLSGGEQALTAITLIFAVFLTNPAPICILDEADGPLDGANVERFCDLLNEINNRTRTRFIIITHNEITMSRMNRLYGVTMPEGGVSKLVSVNLERIEELRARA